MPARARTSRPALSTVRRSRAGAAALLLVLGVVGVTGCSAGAPSTAAPAPTAAASPAPSEASSTPAPDPSADPSPPAADPSSSAAAPSSPAAPSVEAAGPTVTIDDFAYDVPATVSPGATVVVSNVDVEAHTLTAKGDGGFAVSVPVDGQGTFVAPTTPGDYPFVCLLHGGMEGVLTVG